MTINGDHYICEDGNLFSILKCRRCGKYMDCECEPLTIPQIKEIIAKHCTPGKPVYPSDIAFDYNIDYDDVLAAVAEFREEGRVGDAQPATSATITPLP